MSIDGTGNPAIDDKTPAGTGENGDRRTEQASRQQAGPDDDRGHRRAETRTREEYADAVRTDGPPIRQESADAREPERDGDHAVTLHGEPADDRPASAEPLNREEYAEAMRGNGADAGDQERPEDPGTDSARDTSTTAGAVTHFHGEFKGQQLDLYTDGTRWAAAETPRTQDTVSEKGDIPDRLPTGEELVDSADEASSRLDRFRHKLYDQSDDALDSLEKNTNTAHDIFSHPPTSSYETTPTPEPQIYEAQHSVLDPGAAATAIFTFGLVIDRAIHWAMGHYDKHAH